MKIAQIAPAWLPIPPRNYGGTENVISHLVEAQVAAGHDVTLIATSDSHTDAKLVSFVPHGLLDEGVPWHTHRKAYYHLHKAIEYVRQQDFDIVHTHLSSAADLYLFPLLSDLDTPHITTLHSNFPLAQRLRYQGEIENYYLEWASRLPLVAISASARAQQPEKLHFVGVVHHGIDMQHYHPTTKRQENFFVWLGRFSPEKGPHLAIEAAKRAGVRLQLAGTIDTTSKETRAYFHEQIKPSIDNDQIRYSGPASIRRKLSLFSRARGFLNPIEWEEPFGMVMIEAMATGCPVISFSRGAAPEIIEEGTTGYLVTNVAKMVKAIECIEKLDRSTIRDHMQKHFSATAMANRYQNIYHQTIAG